MNKETLEAIRKEGSGVMEEDKDLVVCPCCIAVMIDHNRYVNAVVQVVGVEVAVKIAELAYSDKLEAEHE
jgi:DNA-binding IclR family transcriptional regulator